MKSATRRLHSLDQDLLTALEARDRRLYRLIDRATVYRARLRRALSRLRAGEHPALVRADLEQAAPILTDLRRLAAERLGSRVAS